MFPAQNNVISIEVSYVLVYSLHIILGAFVCFQLNELKV
jgi:hypothetical protein